MRWLFKVQVQYKNKMAHERWEGETPPPLPTEKTVMVAVKPGWGADGASRAANCALDAVLGDKVARDPSWEAMVMGVEYAGNVNLDQFDP